LADGSEPAQDLKARLSLGPGDRVLAVMAERITLLAHNDPTVEKAFAFAEKAVKRCHSPTPPIGRLVRGSG